MTGSVKMSAGFSEVWALPNPTCGDVVRDL